MARFLVLGATGGTGKHFVAQVVADGHKVRALARSPDKLTQSADLEVWKGSITDDLDMEGLVKDVDYVVSMLGDKDLQRDSKINTAFVKKLIPAMRKAGVRRFMYQAGGFSRPHDGSLSVILWILRYTIARPFEGQHQDNEAVMSYLATEANDIEWMVHRAGIGSDGPSKGVLYRSETNFSIGTHIDCASFNYRTVTDDSAVCTTHFSQYGTS